MQHFNASQHKSCGNGPAPLASCASRDPKNRPQPSGSVAGHNPMPAEVVKKGVPILMNKSLPGSGVLPEATIRSVEADNAVPLCEKSTASPLTMDWLPAWARFLSGNTELMAAPRLATS